MDTAAFATWLGVIGLLDRGQRAEAFRELALAEADDPIDPSADPVGAAVLPSEAAVAPSLPVADTDNAAPEEDLLSKVGRGRIGRFGSVTLPYDEREVSALQKLSGRCDCRPPRVHRRSAKRAVRLG